MNGKNPKSRILRHMTISYTLFLLIPIAMGVMFLVMARQVLWDNLLESNARQLSFGATMISDSLSAADDYILALTQNETVKELINNPVKANSYSIRHVANSIPRFRTVNGIADRCFFYYYGNGDANSYILSAQQVFLRPDLYYNSCFRYGDMTSEGFWNFIKNNKRKTIYPARGTWYFNEFSRAILMASPYTMKGSAKIMGQLMIYLKTDKMMEIFEPLFASGTAWMGIYDGQGTALYSTSEEGFASYITSDILSGQGAGTETLKGDLGQYTCQYYRDKESDWIFLTLTANRVLSEQAAPLLWVVVAGVAIFILLAFCLIGTLSKSSRRPLAQMADILQLENGVQRGLWPLTASVEKLKSDNEGLSRQLSVQNTHLRDAAVAQLVNGSFEDVQEMVMLLKHTGVEIEDSDEYRGVYLKLLHQSSLSEATLPHIDYRHTVLHEALMPFSPALQWLTLKNEREYILLFTKIKEAAPLDELMASVYSVLKNTYGADIALFVGPPCDELCTLYQSFAAAKELSVSEPEGEKYLYLAEQKNYDKSFDYSQQDEAALLAAAQRNEMEKITALLSDIYDRNFRQRKLSAFMQQSLYGVMVHAIARVDCPLPVTPTLMEVPIRLTEQEFFQTLHAQYETVCAWIRENRHRDSRLMLDNVLAFMEEHYAEPDMSLTYTAMHFGLTEQYLSEGFKRRAGCNFSTYLEQKRILRAQQLLRETDQNVQSIAESVGYSNIRTFRRAYSRVLGHPPSKDRKGTVEGDENLEEEKWRE